MRSSKKRRRLPLMYSKAILINDQMDGCSLDTEQVQLRKLFVETRHPEYNF